MEEIIQNQNPVWLIYLSSLGPLILTGISVFIACKQHKQSQNLQKQIANRDSTILLRQNVLEIYNAYFNGLRVVNQTGGNVADVFSTPQSVKQWSDELQRAYEAITNSYNLAKLMFDDKQLLQTLRNSFEKFNDLYFCVNNYYHSEFLLATITTAWNRVSFKYGITKEDYMSLLLNSEAKEDYLKQCENHYTQDIQKSMDAFIVSMKDENFDVYFKEYIKMSDL